MKKETQTGRLLVVFLETMWRTFFVVVVAAFSFFVVFVTVFEILYGETRMEWVDSSGAENGNLHRIAFEDGLRMRFRFDDYFTTNGVYKLQVFREGWMISSTAISIHAVKTDYAGGQSALGSFQMKFDGILENKSFILFPESFAPKAKRERLVLDFQVESTNENGIVTIHRAEISLESKRVFHPASV